MFYVEMPGDEYGNTGHGLVVIEATPEVREYGGGEWLHVTAPAEFVSKWPRLFRGAHGGWKETEGPARTLTEAEWAQLTGFGDRDA